MYYRFIRNGNPDFSGFIVLPSNEPVIFIKKQVAGGGACSYSKTDQRLLLQMKVQEFIDI